MRLKYPFLVKIALAASAPIFLDSVGLTSPWAYYQVVENATAKISPACPAAVKAAFTAYRAVASPAARQEQLGLCAPVGPSEYGWDPLEFYLVQYFATMAMFNYPPTASALGRACGHILGTPQGPRQAGGMGLAPFKRLLQALTPANGTCFDLGAQVPGDVPGGAGFAGSAGSVACSDWSGCGKQGGGLSWDYQACTQVTQPLGLHNNSRMFLPRPWTTTWMEEHCKRRFNVVPQFNHLADTMGLRDISSWPGNIIFSNGLQVSLRGAGGVRGGAGGAAGAPTRP